MNYVIAQIVLAAFFLGWHLRDRQVGDVVAGARARVKKLEEIIADPGTNDTAIVSAIEADPDAFSWQSAQALNDAFHYVRYQSLGRSDVRDKYSEPLFIATLKHVDQHLSFRAGTLREAWAKRAHFQRVAAAAAQEE